jgi:hypothetical protein
MSRCYKTFPVFRLTHPPDAEEELRHFLLVGYSFGVEYFRSYLKYLGYSHSFSTITVVSSHFPIPFKPTQFQFPYMLTRYLG